MMQPFTTLSTTPRSGYRFPPAAIALAVRWYRRYRLSDAAVAELLAERGIAVALSTYLRPGAGGRPAL